MVIRRRGTERHLPHGITQCYLPTDTGERTPPKHKPDRPVLDLPIPEGWKAELTLVVGCIPRWFTCLQTFTHPSSNHLIATSTWPGGELASNVLHKALCYLGRKTNFGLFVPRTICNITGLFEPSVPCSFSNTTKC